MLRRKVATDQPLWAALPLGRVSGAFVRPPVVPSTQGTLV